MKDRSKTGKIKISHQVCSGFLGSLNEKDIRKVPQSTPSLVRWLFRAKDYNGLEEMHSEIKFYSFQSSLHTEDIIPNQSFLLLLAVL
jgi:hypothetical protein